MKFWAYCRQFVAYLWLAFMCVMLLAAAVMFGMIFIVIPIHHATIWAGKMLGLDLREQQWYRGYSS